MTPGKVLVTGASGGQQGRTGRHVAEMLLARGVPVRAFVHRLDERSERLRGLGADVVEGDFEEISDQEWQSGALARGASRHAVEHLSNLWRTLRGFAQQPRTFQVSDTIEALGGAKPKTFETFLREEKDALTLELARTA